MTQRRIYQNCHPYLITTNVLKRAPLFESEEYAKVLSDTIIDVCNDLDCELYAFCIMPDHVHLLLRTNNENNISTILQQIKSLTAKDLRGDHGFNVKFWQPRFYHKLIKTTSAFNSAIAYIKENPLKWRLDSRFLKSPYMFIDEKGIKTL